MKKIKILAVVLCSIFFVYASALADKGVFNAQINPIDTITDRPTNVTITAEVGSENLYISSVRAYLTSETGKPISLIGQMYDDGTHGDARPADTIFTIQFEVNQPAESEFYYVVTAAYNRDRNRYLSNILNFKIHLAIPESTTQEINQNLNSFQQKYHDLLGSMAVEEAIQTIFSEIVSDPKVLDAEISENIITILYKSGLRGVVLLDDPNIPVQGAGSAIPPNSIPNNAKYPGNDKLMIWSPHYTNNLDYNADYAKDRFGKSVFMEFSPNPPTITSDANASLDSIKNWGEFGAVIIDTHGGVSTVNGQDLVLIETGTLVVNPLPADTQADWRAGRITPTGSNRWAFYPSYISDRAKNMKNTFFWLGACHSLDNDTMWDAIKGKGGKSAFGWDGTVSVSFEDSRFKKVIDGLIRTDSGDDIQTVREVFDGIGDKVDGWCPFGFCIGGDGATLELRTESEDWDNFLFLDGGIVNGDFETGDWTGWTHGGENGQTWQLVLGARVHNGSFAASLGRWDTAYHGNDPTVEPYGYEWFYQDFTVPSNVTTLKFHWWMETYDTAVWDWFDAYIKDTNGNILKTIVSKGGKPGTDYGPYWNTGGWIEESVDISLYQGQKIRIYFDQRLDGWGDQQRVYVDDVTLE